MMTYGPLKEVWCLPVDEWDLGEYPPDGVEPLFVRGRRRGRGPREGQGEPHAQAEADHQEADQAGHHPATESHCQNNKDTLISTLYLTHNVYLDGILQSVFN